MKFTHGTYGFVKYFTSIYIYYTYYILLYIILLNIYNTINLPRLHSVDGSTGGMILKRQPKYPEETSLSVILPTTNST